MPDTPTSTIPSESPTPDSTSASPASAMLRPSTKVRLGPAWRTTLIRLKHLTPLVGGSTRLIYAHPDDPDLLIKVMRPEALERHSAGSWHKRLRKDRPVKVFLRESREYLVLIARGDAPAPFLQGVAGFAATDVGVGLVVEALRGPDGEIAPTVLRLIQERKFTEVMQRDLDRFLQELSDSSVALSGIATYNVVYAYDSVHGQRFVLVDGFGDRSFLHLKSFLPRLNQKAKRRQLEWFAREVARLRRSPGQPRSGKTR